MSAVSSSPRGDRWLLTLTGLLVAGLSVNVATTTHGELLWIDRLSGYLVAAGLVIGLGLVRGAMGSQAVGMLVRGLVLLMATAATVAKCLHACAVFLTKLVEHWEQQGGWLGWLLGKSLGLVDSALEWLIGAKPTLIAGYGIWMILLGVGLVATILGLSRRSPAGAVILSFVALLVMALNIREHPWNTIEGMMVLSAWGLLLQPARDTRDVRIIAAVISVAASLLAVGVAVMYLWLPADLVPELPFGLLGYIEDASFLALTLRLLYLSFRDATRLWRH